MRRGGFGLVDGLAVGEIIMVDTVLTIYDHRFAMAMVDGFSFSGCFGFWLRALHNQKKGGNGIVPAILVSLDFPMDRP
jgi:hypothetical protein